MKLLNYRSKIGTTLASLYVLLLIWALVAFLNTYTTNPRAGIGFLILTLPGSFALGIMFDFFGVRSGMNIGFICVFFGGAVNALGLYFLGYLFTTMFIALRDAIRDLLSRRSRK